uniref:Peptidylprolyl isomerase n=1 Tax=Oryza barthii TaxID=65489 RepID=A0A0D3EQ93_9ORYZ
MPISLELGEPDQSFYNLWKEECEELWEEEDELWGDEDVEEELSLRHPGFNKWTVQQAAAGGDLIRAKDKNFYCLEVQGEGRRKGRRGEEEMGEEEEEGDMRG